MTDLKDMRRRILSDGGHHYYYLEGPIPEGNIAEPPFEVIEAAPVLAEVERLNVALRRSQMGEALAVKMSLAHLDKSKDLQRALEVCKRQRDDWMIHSEFSTNEKMDIMQKQNAEIQAILEGK